MTEPIRIIRADGARSTYANITPTSWAALESLKPPKPPKSKADRRLYPQWHADMSTRDYIKAYFALNSNSRKLPAYPDHTNHLALYVPLPDTPAQWAPDTVEVELVGVAA